jgi:putative hydroxymethylpyrimidine transport system substrate-binding protein
MRKLVLSLCLLLCLPLFAAAKTTLKPLTVILDWFVNPQHAPLIITQEKGFFKQHGLNVRIIAPADPVDPPKLVAAGKADIAIGYQTELYLQVNAGLPLGTHWHIN